VITRRALLAAGAVGALQLAGCGGSDPRLGTARRALVRRSVAIDYASLYAPIEDVRRLVAARAAAVGAAVTFSDDAAGVDAQVANLRRWTGEEGGFKAIAIAAFDPAAVDPVAAAAIRRGVRIVSYVTPLAHRSAAIAVDHARAGRLLAEHAARAGRGAVLLVRPAATATPDPFAPGFAPAEAAIRAVLGDRVVAAVAAQGQADGAEAIGAALRANPRIRTVLAWNDLTALAAADALGTATGYAGGLGSPALTGRAGLRALAADTSLRCLVAPRLADLAAALVDVPLALARGRPTAGRTVPLHVLTRSTRAAVRAFAADYTR